MTFTWDNTFDYKRNYGKQMMTSSLESQKGAIADQRCSVENQKGTIAVQSQWQ